MDHSQTRRALLKHLALPIASSFASALTHSSIQVKAQQGKLLAKPIPSTGEMLSAIGMGTWITFNVGNNDRAIANCTDILSTFFSLGGSVVDSSPMYGSAEATLGSVFENLPTIDNQKLFSASKIWTSSDKRGIEQFTDSMRLWRQPNFDLFQVHNLLNWRSHIETLEELKEKKAIRYLGITTSHGRRHGDFIEVMKTVKPDFIQVTYNVIDREVERDILPLAADLGIAVIANRPFQGGHLFSYVNDKPLPSWAKEIDCHNWAQLFLKFIVSHPAVTCAIPATSQVSHMRENMGALTGVMPDEPFRQRITSLL